MPIYGFRPDEYNFLVPTIFKVEEKKEYEYSHLLSVGPKELEKIPSSSPFVRLDKNLDAHKAVDITSAAPIVLKIKNKNNGELIVVGDRDIFEVNGKRGFDFRLQRLLEMTGGKILVGTIFNALFDASRKQVNHRMTLSPFLREQYNDIFPVIDEKKVEIQRLKEFETKLVLNASQSGGLSKFKDEFAEEFNQLELSMMESKRLNEISEKILEFISMTRIKIMIFATLNLFFVSSILFVTL